MRRTDSKIAHHTTRELVLSLTGDNELLKKQYIQHQVLTYSYDEAFHGLPCIPVRVS